MLSEQRRQHGFCLIVETEGIEDETEILPYAKPSVWPTGADVRQSGDGISRSATTIPERLQVVEHRASGFP
jgi:hypothetical protein